MHRVVDTARSQPNASAPVSPSRPPDKGMRGAVFARARIAASDLTDGISILRVAHLTHDVIQQIAADVLRAGPGATLDLTVAAEATDEQLAGVTEQFAWLKDRGVRVRVRREGQARHDPPEPTGA